MNRRKREKLLALAADRRQSGDPDAGTPTTRMKLAKFGIRERPRGDRRRREGSHFSVQTLTGNEFALSPTFYR